MIQFLQSLLGPYYLFIKFVHVIAVTVWLWSTAVGYAFYLVPVFKAWRRNPDDTAIIALRDWAMERFDHGVIYEHLAFPMVLLSGPLLWIASGWSPAAGWFLLKLLIVVTIFIPIEICDYYLAHLGGNKQRLRAAGNPDLYERAIHRHWWFLLLTSAPVIVFGVLVIFLAVVKPF
jgi:uncharacterized membrane protein